jgi:hypothetical protein
LGVRGLSPAKVKTKSKKKTIAHSVASNANLLITNQKPNLIFMQLIRIKIFTKLVRHNFEL